MKQKPDEKPINYLRRLVKNFDFELEAVLTSLPSLKAIFEFVDMLARYDVVFLAEVQERISEGADPEPLRRFVNDWNLSELKFFSGGRIWTIPEKSTK